MILKPFKDYVLIEPIEQNSISKGGIILPNVLNEKTTEGIVVAFNVQNKYEGLKNVVLNKGDRILFNKVGSISVRLNKKNYIIVKDSSIIGMLT